MNNLKNRTKFIILMILLMISPVSALQQTTGALLINITQGEQGYAKYGIRNEDNQSVTVKLSVNGTIADYIEYPKEITMVPGEFTYVNVTTNISSDYNGSKQLDGIIYALKEGEKGGQVQLNIRLGKRISLNITEPLSKQETETPNNVWIIISITIICLVAVAAVAMARRKSGMYKLKGKEVENK